MVAKTFIDFNGIVVEKYDVTRPIDPHKNEAEYGNHGSDFKGVAREVRYPSLWLKGCALITLALAGLRMGQR